jgi:hypothetical protein
LNIDIRAYAETTAMLSRVFGTQQLCSLMNAWQCLSSTMSCATSLNTKSEYVSILLSKELILFWEMYPDCITKSPAQYVMDLHKLKRQVGRKHCLLSLINYTEEIVPENN